MPKNGIAQFLCCIAGFVGVPTGCAGTIQESVGPVFAQWRLQVFRLLCSFAALSSAETLLLFVVSCGGVWLFRGMLWTVVVALERIAEVSRYFCLVGWRLSGEVRE